MHNFHLFREHTCQLDQIEPLENETLLSFVNHFISTMHQQMIRFATQIESRLIPLQRKLEICQTNLVILEMKLNSIDIPLERLQKFARPKPETSQANTEVNNLAIPTQTEIATISTTEAPLPPVPTPSLTSESECPSKDNQSSEPSTGEPVQDDTPESNAADEYSESLVLYRKMLKLGIPHDAVLQKMKIDGIDPAIQSKL